MEFWDVGQNSIMYMWMVVLTYVPIKGGIVHHYAYGFLNCSGKALPLPSHNAEVEQYGGMTCGGLVATYG